MDEELVQAVRQRAGDTCEYCRVPQSAYPTVTFPIDHIIARQHGGPTILSNLALSCLHDNAHKGTNLTGIDPVTKKITKLYNPRRHKWAKHFRWHGALLVGLTPVGRTTIVVLAMNDPEAVAVRQALLDEGSFPPAG
jgi:hypothetical protein